MGDVGVDGDVVGRGAEVGGVEVAVDGGEAFGDAVPGDEVAGDGVDAGPIELGAAGGRVDAEPDRGVNAGAAADVQDRDLAGLGQAQRVGRSGRGGSGGGGDRGDELFEEGAVGFVMRVCDDGASGADDVGQRRP